MYVQNHDTIASRPRKEAAMGRRMKPNNLHHSLLIFYILISISHACLPWSWFTSDPSISVLAFKTLVNFEAEHLKLWESPLIIHLFFKVFAVWIIFSDIQSLPQFYERLNASYAPLYILNSLSRNGLQSCIKQIASVNQIESYIFRYKNLLNWPLKCLVISVPC